MALAVKRLPLSAEYQDSAFLLRTNSANPARKPRPVTKPHMHIFGAAPLGEEASIDQAEARAFRQMYKYACEMRPFLPKMSGPILKQICSTLENINPKSDQGPISLATPPYSSHSSILR
jgi:hypothetical protein